ncbi:MAG: potassium-transporting ATPase subunit KdpC [Bryobacterales bacterium]
MQFVRQAFLLLALMSVLLGIVYPLALTGVAQVAMPKRAGGSLIVRSGRVIGSEWIGQSFEDPGRFWGRISATGPAPYQAEASSGSNLSPFGEAFRKQAVARLEALRGIAPANGEPAPADLVTASGSGLDPHISPEAAYYQAERVARALNLDKADIDALIAAHTEGRTFGILGQPRVNVLLLNMALEDRQ